MPRVPILATGYHWKADGVTLQVALRHGVMFHDGAVWNSTSAKWNFDRIMLLTNSSGDLPLTSPLAEAASLYFFNMTYNDDGILNGGTPIIKSVTAVGEWNITIVLNAPFAPFLDLLCFEGSLMTSPKSTPADRFLNLDEKLVGTGPYKFDSFTPNVDVRFSRNENYWRPAAGFQKMVFSIIQDPVTLNNAMLGGQLDLISGVIASLLPQYEADPNVFVWHITDDIGITGLSYYYLGFNNVLINQTMRGAISYAINYTYIIEQMSNNLVFRANSPIAPGYGDAYNASVKAAYYNLTIARQILLDNIPYLGTLGLTANDDITGANSLAWQALDLGNYNYSYNTDNSFRSDLLVPLQNWCAQIGVHVIDNGGTWDDFLTKLYVNHNQLGLYWVGWGPDYLDPFNMLDPLFNPASSSDSAQVDDPFLNSLLELALNTPDQMPEMTFISTFNLIWQTTYILTHLDTIQS
jgi:ABC-type transport system substrate-binding protein